jgi:hypothetical protein
MMLTGLVVIGGVLIVAALVIVPAVVLGLIDRSYDFTMISGNKGRPTPPTRASGCTPAELKLPFCTIDNGHSGATTKLTRQAAAVILVTDPRGAREATINSLVTLTLPEMPSMVTPLV